MNHVLPVPPVDLSTRRAGAAAREQALALRAAAPVRTVLDRLLGRHSDERAWRIGADGEEKVGAVLAVLTRRDPRWRTLHAIPVGSRGADIDHLIIGPAGVFTLNAKHHPGADVWVAGSVFMVNGRRQPYLRNSRHEASRASALLSSACAGPVTVEGIVVPVGAQRMVVKDVETGLYVVNRRRLARWLMAREPVLDDRMIGQVYEAARWSTTWSAPARGVRRTSPDGSSTVDGVE